MAELPRSTFERLRGRERKITDLIYVRPPGSQRVYVGLVGAGYVRMKLEEARQLAVRLLSLTGAGGDDQAPLVVCECGAGSGSVARFCHACGAELGG